MKEELEKLNRNASALIDAIQLIYTNDENKIGQYTSYSVFVRKYCQIVDNTSQFIDVSLLDRYDVNKLPDPFSLTWPQQKQIFDGVLVNLILLVSLIGNSVDFKQDKIKELRDFLLYNLRKVIRDIPKNEKEIQDRIEDLLVGRGYLKGNDYDREKGRVKCSIKEVVPDFIFPKLGLALEVKFTKDGSKTRNIVDEINADIQSYSKVYSYILFLVYDVGTISDEDEFKNDIDNQDSILVLIVKH